MFVGQSAGWLLWDPDFESCLDQMPSVYSDLQTRVKRLVAVKGFWFWYGVVTIFMMSLRPKKFCLFWYYSSNKFGINFPPLTAVGGLNRFWTPQTHSSGPGWADLGCGSWFYVRGLWWSQALMTCPKDTDISLEEVPVPRFWYLNGWCHQV